ncbi:hypothetical protein [Endozoicomonas sp. ONNA1]|uniref:hypothetical protein n=1 Tax=Endozoicomonas sp. ONNA1 TaxID=2828740 RepID=UPI002147D81C|nr:hypothetical protein [Endozoicomonas sp. ONNA1]
MFGAIGQSVGMQQYSHCGLGRADLLLMSIGPERYSLERWEEVLKNIKPDISDAVGISPLQYVIRSIDYCSTDNVPSEKLVSIIKLLISYGADCNYSNGSLNSPLHMLCSNRWDDLPHLRELAFEQVRNNGIEPDSLMSDGEPLLLAMSHHPDRCSLMAWEAVLNKGLSPNVSGYFGETPLIKVIQSSTKYDVPFKELAPIIELLIKRGADCNQLNNTGDTVLQILCSKEWGNFPKLIELAFEQVRNNGIEPDSLMFDDKPLLFAMSIHPDRYSLTAWETVLNNGINPNISYCEEIPLIEVIQSSTNENVPFEELVPIIELLIKHGADCNQANYNGDTALQILFSKKWDEFPKLRELALEQKRNNGIESDSLMSNGERLLLGMSIYPDRYSLMTWETVLHKGLNPNISDRFGISPLRYVIYSMDRNPMDDERSQKLESIIKLLIKCGADCNEANGAGDTALESLCLQKWDDFPKLRELAFEQIRNNGIEPDSLMGHGKPLLTAMSEYPEQHSKLGLRSIIRYGVLPVLKEDASEESAAEKPNLDCDFNDELEKHKAYFCARPLEYRCICAVDRNSRGQELTMLPRQMQKNIKHLFYS